MVSLGFNQIISYSFVPASIDESIKEKKPLALKNPLSEEQGSMRTSLKWGMFDALRRNILNDEFNLRFFEMGHVFHPTAGELSEEHSRLCFGITGAFTPLDWRRSQETSDLFVLKGLIQNLGDLFGYRFKFNSGSCSAFHPTMQMEVIHEKTVVGQIGQIHPNYLDNRKMPKSIFIAEIDLGLLAEKSVATPRMTAIPELPAIRRDLALLVPNNVNHRDIVKIISEEGKNLLEDHHLFDIYQGKGIAEGFRSMAYSLTFRDPAKTLTDEQIQPLIDKMVCRLEKTLAIKLR
jgi:phenylalanyl-tRNA synthetase beta chain